MLENLIDFVRTQRFVSMFKTPDPVELKNNSLDLDSIDSYTFNQLAQRTVVNSSINDVF